MKATFLRLGAAGAALVAVLVVVTALWQDAVNTRDEMFTDHRRQAEAVAAALAVTADRDDISRVIARTLAGAEGRVAVHFSSAPSVGARKVPVSDIGRAVIERRPLTTDLGGERAYLLPVVLPSEDVAVVEVRFPDQWLSTDLAARGGVLMLVAAAATAAAALLVQNLARPMLSATSGLVATARSLGPGGGSVRVPAEAPTEFADLAAALSDISHRWERLLTDEHKVMADLSHRLRTPLTALRLDVEALDTGALGDRVRQSVAEVERIVDQVITKASVSTDRDDETTDAGRTVSDRMAFWYTLAETQKRPSKLHCTTEPTLVRLRAAQLEDALDGLMVNVFQHTPPGAPIAVFVVRHADWVTVVVDDGGNGIADPDAALRRGSSGGGSTGLGLDIARSCAELAGGTIHLERGSLGGARVRLRFPVVGHDPARTAPKAWRLFHG